GRHVNMDIGLFEGVGRDAEFADAAFDEAQGGLGAFFHDVADLAGEEDAAFPRITQRFDVKDLTAGRSPSQARDDSGFAGLEFGFAYVFRRAEEPLHHFLGDLEFASLAPGEKGGGGAADGADLAFEFT